jgi:Carboxypeptidase regulatory-like domain/TonB dependent receptor
MEYGGAEVLNVKNATMHSLWKRQSSRNCKLLYLYILGILAVFLFKVPVALAQNITGDLLGTATDSSGAAVANATVTATEIQTQLQRSVTTNGQGEYTMSQMKPGVYRISVSAAGFKKADISGITLSPGDRKRTDVVLKVGEATESVSVTAEANGLQTDSSSVSSTIGGRSLQELPLNGRNFIQLAQDQPGTNGGTPNSVTNGIRPDDRRQTTEVVANGQPEILNNFLIDGLDDNDRLVGFMEIRPSLDAISEVKIATNLYSAEVGRTAGAVSSIFTKSGTNSLHGTGYEFFRNNITDAKSYFSTTNPTLQQNQFGGSIGGPIRPGKTFFFGDYEGFYKNDATQNVTILTVPTLFEEQNPGNFSDASGPVFTPTDTTGLGYFHLYPAPNRTPVSVDASGFASGNYISDPASVQHQNTFDVRIDQNFNSANQLFGRYSFANTHTFTPSELPAVGNVQPVGDTFGGRFPGTASERAQNAQLNYLHIFTPKLLMELRGGYSRFTNSVLGLNSGKNLNNTPALSIPGANEAYRATELAYVFFGSYAPLGGPCCEPIYQTDNTVQVNGDLTYNLGAHSIKVGAGLIHRDSKYFQSTYGQGFIIEALGGTPVLNMAKLLGYNGGGFYGYLYERSNLFNDIKNRFWESNTFIQDDWRLNRRLTLNLGLRYNIYTAPYNTNNTMANFDLSTLTLIQDPTGGVSTPYGDVAPRFGFAYSATDSTVIRGGFGISYYPSVVNGAINLLNPPYSSSTGLQFAIDKYLYQGIGTPTVPSTTNLSGSINTKPRNLPDSYAEQFNLTIQQQIRRNVLTVAYVGQLGRHETIGGINIDLPDPSGSSVVPAFRYAAQLPNVVDISNNPASASSSYNAFQATFRREFTNGLSINANYTWAHGLDNTFDSGTALPSTYGLIPSRTSTYDYGNSDLDIRHRVAVLGSYVMPFAKSASGFKRFAIKGWQINTVTTWQTGLPFTVTDAVTQTANSSGLALAHINLPGVGVDRPNVIGDVGGGGSLGQFFNIKAFVPQAIGTPGNERKNQYYGPHLRHADLSLVKNFDLPREANLQFRVECFNISNTPNFSNPSAQINQLGPDGLPTSSGLFGAITSVNPNISPREFQFGLKLSY